MVFFSFLLHFLCYISLTDEERTNSPEVNRSKSQTFEVFQVLHALNGMLLPDISNSISNNLTKLQ